MHAIRVALDAARLLGPEWLPQEVQAITWLVWRAELDNRPGDRWQGKRVNLETDF